MCLIIYYIPIISAFNQFNVNSGNQESSRSIPFMVSPSNASHSFSGQQHDNRNSVQSTSNLFFFNLYLVVILICIYFRFTLSHYV